MDGDISLAPIPSDLPVAVIGAGPVGLAAAAHLLARGEKVVLLEAASEIAAHVRDYGHVRLFSPWRYNIDAAARTLLERHGWTAPPPERLPTGQELVDLYLQPLAATPEIAAVLKLGHRVDFITRAGFDKVKSKGREAAPFLLRVTTTDCLECEIRARAVIDCSGTWSQPNPLGASGLPATGEAMRSARIRYGIPDSLGRERARYAGRRTMVVGSGHSAANALLDLAHLAREVPGTRIDWAVRTSQDVQKAFGGGAADQLAARGALGSALRRLFDSGVVRVHPGLRIAAVQVKDGAIVVVGEDGTAVEGIDEVVAATGQRPDLAMTRELRLRLDPWLECPEALGPLIDPNLHSCGTVRPHGARELAHPEPGFYTAGVKSYGRAPTFLLATGYEQVRSIAAALTGDWVAAREVHLDLPQTGVCSATPLTAALVGAASGTAPASACCGPAPVAAEWATAAPAVVSAASETASTGTCCGPAAVAPELAAPAVGTGDATDRASAAKGCGASATVPVAAAAKPASACCGSTPPTAEQCCDPVAKDEAIAAGAGCCGPAQSRQRVEADVAAVETDATSRPAAAKARPRETAA